MIVYVPKEGERVVEELPDGSFYTDYVGQRSRVWVTCFFCGKPLSECRDACHEED